MTHLYYKRVSYINGCVLNAWMLRIREPESMINFARAYADSFSITNCNTFFTHLAHLCTELSRKEMDRFVDLPVNNNELVRVSARARSYPLKRYSPYQASRLLLGMNKLGYSDPELSEYMRTALVDLIRYTPNQFTPEDCAVSLTALTIQDSSEFLLFRDLGRLYQSLSLRDKTWQIQQMSTVIWALGHARVYDDGFFRWAIPEMATRLPSMTEKIDGIIIKDLIWGLAKQRPKDGPQRLDKPPRPTLQDSNELNQVLDQLESSYAEDLREYGTVIVSPELTTALYAFHKFRPTSTLVQQLRNEILRRLVYKPETFSKNSLQQLSRVLPEDEEFHVRINVVRNLDFYRDAPSHPERRH